MCTTCIQYNSVCFDPPCNQGSMLVRRQVFLQGVYLKESASLPNGSWQNQQYQTRARMRHSPTKSRLPRQIPWRLFLEMDRIVQIVLFCKLMQGFQTVVSRGLQLLFCKPFDFQEKDRRRELDSMCPSRPSSAKSVPKYTKPFRSMHGRRLL